MSGNNQKNNQVRPFGLKDKLGYMFGDFGNDFSFIFASSYLMVFYTKVLGVSGAIVGTLFLAARFVDAFTDVGMGRICDTMKPAKDGRFRSWIRRMAVPVAIASMLMYMYFVKDWSYTAKIIYMSVTYLLWGSICYTGINIPYGSMASVVSADAGDRSALSTFRSMGSTLASLAINVIAPLIIYTTDEAGNQVVVPENFTIIAVVFGILAIVCYTICYKFVIERVQVTPKKEEQVSLLQSFKGIFKNRALLSLIGAALMLLLAMILSQSMNTYLFMDYFKNTKLLAVTSFFSVGAMLAAAPFASILSKKFGKKESGSVSILIAAAAYMLMFFLKIESPVVFIVLMMVGYFGMGFFNMIIWAFVTDVIDYQEVRTYKREDGTVYAIYSFSRKVGQALAGGLGGFVLTAIGYASGAASQTAEVSNKVYSVATLAPGLCYLGVFLVMTFAYPLTKAKVQENSAELIRRRGAQK
ncbi:MFS transporter [Anaerobium acetethylicum]|uniref:Glycoside/pentoside/hexuronide:cation symporter, GPH family n=1 Tax=Anaerobium acetethylicum TaxID=1619234 RepID=A0A1D3TR42_9FIRM|nr:glycoside-pentoside-hexuronide (GPH):cation symporter [Anaerobium acetethylicum]SCP96123.1 glycoside/pentoside/hexuronide:cation symporter, GPH family [Anaerobium acetethylicum]